MTLNEQKERKGLEIVEWIKLVGYIASILVAATSLLSASKNVPSWWFHFSLIFLSGLVFSIPCVIFAKSISKKVQNFRLKRRRDTIMKKHFSRFIDLVDVAKRFASPLRSIEDSLRTHYSDNIKSSLVMHVLENTIESEVNNSLFEIGERLKESDKSFRDLYLIMKQFELCLNVYKRHLKNIEVFVHEIEEKIEKPIPKGIEGEFETFREKFNGFVKDFKEYCREVNKELGERKFPEGAISHIRKW